VTQYAYFTRLFLSFAVTCGFNVHNKCNFIDSHKKSMASVALKLMKLRNAQQNYVQISDTKLHPKREVNVENKLTDIIKTQQNALNKTQYSGSQNTLHIKCHLLHISAPRCHYQGVFQEQKFVMMMAPWCRNV
jgi:hypothetical protein